MDYSPEVARRFRSTARTLAGSETATDAAGGAVAESEDRTLNVWIRFRVQVDAGIVRDARFSAFGCPHTIAAADRAAEWLQGKPAAALRRLDAGRIARELDVPIEKLGKLLRIEDAVRGCADRLGVPAGAPEI